MPNHFPIRIATLGHDAVLAELLAAARRSDRFDVVACYDSQAAAGAIAPATPSPAEDSWEVLLSDGVADWVAAAQMPRDPTAATRRAEQLKRLVQTGVPLILVHPACDMLLAYELEMNHGDGGGAIHPYCPTADHPLLEALCTAIRSDATELGKIEQCVCERFATAERRQRTDVLEHVARDSLIVRRLLGDVSSVAASGASDEASQWGNLGIHFTGPGELIARWSIGPLRDAAGLRLTVIGHRKTVSVWIPDEGHDVTLSEPLSGVAVPPGPWLPADEFLQHIAPPEETTAKLSHVSWDEACRSLEVTDAVERSVRRKRTIELYHEQVTEQETFKSMMAAGGCGMLLWVLTLLMIAGIVEGLQLPLREMFVWRLWPVVLIAPLAVFLALQLLQLVFPHNAK